jgi:hypothetical protein
LLVRSCFSLFGRAVEIVISYDMSLPCDVNHPLDGWMARAATAGGAAAARLRKFRQPEKEKRRRSPGVTLHQSEEWQRGALGAALYFILD